MISRRLRGPSWGAPFHPRPIGEASPRPQPTGNEFGEKDAVGVQYPRGGPGRLPPYLLAGAGIGFWKLETFSSPAATPLIVGLESSGKGFQAAAE